MMKKLCLLACIFQLVFSCREAKQKSFAEKKAEITKQLEQTPARNFSSYQFKPGSALFSRMNHRSDLVLTFLRDFDDRPDYAITMPTRAQALKIKTAIANLPGYLRNVLKESMVGFYFIKGFLSSGYNEWILDQKTGKIYVFIAFASEILETTAARQLSNRDNSAFKKGEYRSEIRFSPAVSSLDYLFLHEAAHAFDYIHGINHFVDPDHEFFVKYNKQYNTSFMGDYWLSRKKAKDAYRLPFWQKLKFYGFGGGPLLENENLPVAYKFLEQNIYSSLYGASSWAEDFAELVTLYHLTQKRKVQYQVDIYQGKVKKASYDFTRSEKLQKRFKGFDQFYRSSSI